MKIHKDDKIEAPKKETIQLIQQKPRTCGEATITNNRPAMILQRKLKSRKKCAEMLGYFSYSNS